MEQRRQVNFSSIIGTLVFEILKVTVREIIEGNTTQDQILETAIRANQPMIAVAYLYLMDPIPIFSNF